MAGGADNTRPDAEARRQSIRTTQEWPWLDLSAYGLEVVVRKLDNGSEVRIEGPSAAKNLVRASLEACGAQVIESQDGRLAITISTGHGQFNRSHLQELMPYAQLISILPSNIPVKGENDVEMNTLKLTERLERRVFTQEVIRRYAEGAEQFTHNDLSEIGAKAIGVAPELMRNEFGINQRVLQEQLESSLAELFAAEVAGFTNDENIIAFGAKLDRLLPRDSAATGASRQMQQFSTPLSISAALQCVIGISADMTVWEPTAGNGSLVALADRNKVYGLELDEERVKNLHAKGYEGIRQGDAVNGSLNGRKYQRVIMNPPFGAFGDQRGPRAFKSDVPAPNGGTPPKIRTGSQDKYIALRHLDNLDKELQNE